MSQDRIVVEHFETLEPGVSAKSAQEAVSMAARDCDSAAFYLRRLSEAFIEPLAALSDPQAAADAVFWAEIAERDADELHGVAMSLRMWFKSAIQGVEEWDKKASVFAKRDRVGEQWLKSREYTLFRPDDFVALTLRIRDGKADMDVLSGEYQRYLSDNAGTHEASELKKWLDSL